MQRFELIDIQGVVTECLGGSLFRVRLSNGHNLLGHLEDSLAKRVLNGEIKCLPGSVVLLQLRAFDLSAGRIVGIQPVGTQCDGGPVSSVRES